LPRGARGSNQASRGQPGSACLDERAPARGDRAALTPTELVVAWLKEAHRYGTLVAAVRSLLAEPTPVLPLGRLARAASDGARSRAKGETADERNEAIDTAVTEKVFRFRLVLRIITVTCELLDRQLLLEALARRRMAVSVVPT
jgi:hypothetical protein